MYDHSYWVVQYVIIGFYRRQISVLLFFFKRSACKLGKFAQWFESEHCAILVGPLLELKLGMGSWNDEKIPRDWFACSSVKTLHVPSWTA